MQIIILAAGNSTRFYPFNTQHKSCLKILGKTILEHTIESVKKAGIEDIILVIKDDEIKKLFGDGSRLGVHMTYVIQEESLGAGDAILKAKEHIHDDFFVIWGNRIEFFDFADLLVVGKKQKNAGAVLVKETQQIEGVGVAIVENEKLMDIIEKPEITASPSYTKIVGIYLLPKLFLQTLVSVPLEHYSFEKALVAYTKTNPIYAIKTTKKTISLKYPWDILQVKDYLLGEISSHRGEQVTIADSAVITGDVFISDGVTIMEQVTIKGPCYIGKNAYIGTNAILRNKTIIEENVVVGANMEIKNSAVLKGTTTHSGFIGDSIIGENCKVAAYFCTANVRLDREAVQVTVVGKEVNSHLKTLGVIMGDTVKIGVRVTTMPGKVIGRNVTVGAQTSVLHNIEDNINYFTKFAEVVEKKKK
ncbi:MAG: NTP transferase domain-containing protein [Candidatus Levybacteria bacterium]|nr:NTP transferase domain-containing protein [Candidatus Levybacteria bacterium]